MARSACLRAADFQAVHSLAGECRELGDDPVLWRRHQLAGLGRLTGGEFCVAAEVGDGKQPSRSDLGTVDSGADNGFNRAHWLRALTEFRVDAFFNPHMNAYFDRAAWGVVQPRAAFVPDQDWYSSICYQEVVRALGADASLLCLRPIHGTSVDYCGIYLLRHIGAREYSGREQAIAAAAMAVVGPLVGGPLARFADPSPAALPPRTQQVLRCLLEGDSDKQVAHRLHIARMTINQHTKRIYTHFGVQSRPELLARWVRRGWPVGGWADA